MSFFNRTLPHLIFGALTFFCVLDPFGFSRANGSDNQPQYVKDIKRKVFDKDSAEALNLFYDVQWEITVKSSDGKVKELRREYPGTIDIKEKDVVTCTTTLQFAPGLIGKVYYLYYNIKGSLWLKMNGRTLLTTGFFSKSFRGGNMRKEDYESFFLADSVVTFSLVYLPGKVRRNLNEISIVTMSRYDKIIKDEHESEEKNFFTAAFHLAFGVIFLIIFLYHRATSESLYFSIYAFIIGLFYIFNNFELNPFFDLLLFASWVYALEALAIFLAKILHNTDRNKLILFGEVLFIIVMGLIIQFGNLGDSMALNFILVFSVVLLIIFEVITILYYLIQGFFQKRWEARLITYGFCFAVFFALVFFALIMSYGMTYDTGYLELLNYASLLGLVSILVIMSIVLGRRNGENHTRMQAQVVEIETLAKENLAREMEKQHLIESQNIELERKVTDRTMEVMRQKEVIVTKNKEIIDNLQYAKRIQSAILPDPELIRKVFREFFVLYLPRDIVSGDFYSFIHRDDQALLAAADCTGHGVSGAFMSMIGSSLFHQLVNERSMTNPAQILEQLNKEIIRSLRQRSSESNDGMDIAICHFDLKQRMLTYAGANRPMWLIRKGELIAYKADKFPIGGLQFSQQEKFILHQIALKDGDTIYLTTDGFADQFGGPKGKKMLTRKFREALLSVQHLDMAAQEKFLHRFFNEWKGNEDQVDDVLVMGLRI